MRSSRVSITLLFVLSVGLLGLTGVVSAASDPLPRVNLYTNGYTIQNYFFDGEEELPFFDEQSGQINRGVEIRPSDGYIYSFNFTRSTILMRWNTSSDFDAYEPYVGSLLGLSPEEAAEAGIEDRYLITFDEPPVPFEAVASETMSLVPNVTAVGDNQIMVSIPGGTPIGNGFNATIILRPKPAESPLVWDEDPLSRDILAGTAVGVETGFTLADGATSSALTVEIDGEASDYVVVDSSEAMATETDRYTVPLRVTMPSDRTSAITGSLSILDGTEVVGEPLSLNFEPTMPSATVAPPELNDPSAERVVLNDDGVLQALDELVIGVSEEAADPVAVAQAAAAAVDGVFLGSDARLDLYQIQVPAADLNELGTLAATAEAVAGVEFVSFNYLDQNIDTVIPNDSEWDSWDVSTPAGNNWGLEWIDAPGAWDITTGSSDIRVAVIDFGNDDTHEDLDDNATRTAVNGGGSHGTHVAGTACAEGNNGVGVTGVAWDCDLRFFAGGYSAAVTAGRMADAVDDGARVVNMSLNYIENGNCSVDETTLEDEANDANDLFGQAGIYGDRIEREVLWVVAAGNDCGRDAIYTAPGGLGVRFPTNVITVAAMGPDGNLAAFSNTGESVSVAAPGVSIYSTEPGDSYGTKNGTSMASPHVAGLAALVLSDDPTRTSAEVKACIVGSSQTEGTDIVGHPFNTINARAAVACEEMIDLPEEVDIVLALDLSGSMGDVLAQAQAEMSDVVNTLALVAPATDFRFAVVSFEDYSGFYDSTPCGSGYAASYGTSSDQPFKLDAPLTDSTTALNATIGGLFLGSGSDGPESYARVLWEVAQADTGTQLGWRPDALRLAVMFGDSVPHDTNINEGIDGAALASDTGVDPGRNQSVDCGGDDIDMQDDAVADAFDAEVRLLFVDSSGGSLIEPYWRTWSSQTGGAYAQLNDSRPLPDVIVELLSLL